MREDGREGGLAPLQVELREAMGPWGCPLCRLSIKAEHSFIESLSYERVLDLKTRDALKASRGLCQHHSRDWQRLQGSALGVAIVYRISVLDLLRDTDPGREKPGSILLRRNQAQDAKQRLEPSGPCPACGIGAGAAKRFGELLVKDVRDPVVRSLLAGCGGLCLPHLRTVLGLPGAGRAYDALIGAQRQAWGDLMAEIEEFIRKNDYRFADESMTEAEGTSWTRALDVLVGLEDPENRH